jgi:hypothetical protein
MATAEEKSILQGVLEFAAGTLTTLGVNAAAKAVKQHIGTVAEQKANELFVDTGDRAKTLAEVAKLRTADPTTDPLKRLAGFNVQRWIVEAWKDHHEEGDLSSLLRKVPDEDKPAVLFMLGSLGSYAEFTDTIRAFLSHDNALQKALKMVERAESAGETIVGEDIRRVLQATATTINNFAGAARPGVRNLTEALRRIR